MGPDPLGPTIGIITALPVECFAVRSLFGGMTAVSARDPRDGGSYYLGEVPSQDPDRPHRVVLALLTEDGGVAAAHACANLQRTWGVRQLVMCGIACGVPAPEAPERHVRLGDILVADDGVIPYGHVIVDAGGEEIRRPPAKPSVVLKNATRRLRTDAEAGHRPWDDLLDVRGRRVPLDHRRPPAATDVLFDDETGTVVPHPPYALSGHVPDRPKVHYGRIGSGGRLIRTCTERNRLARRYRLIGLDMEGDGVSDGAYLQGVDWFMVRGVSDYGSRKNDAWQRYAALAAAAYVYVLLGYTPPIGAAARRPAAASPPRPVRPWPPPDLDAERGEAIVAVLLTMRTMHDRSGRDRVIAALPARYANRVPRAPDAYHDITNLVQTLCRSNGGLPALLSALYRIEDDSIPMRELAALIAGKG